MAYEQSFWEWNSFFRDIDFLIIGGGIVGLSAGIYLCEQSPGAKVLVLDRGPLPLGASTRNAGFACFGSMTELLADLSQTSAEVVWELVHRRYQGLRTLRQRYGDVALGYEATGGYELFRPEDAGQYRQCLDRREDINRILKDMTGLAETFVEADADLPGLGFGGMAHRLHNQAEGVLDTGRLMRSLLDKAQEVGVRWLGGIAVEGWQEDAAGVEVTTDQGWTVKARRALIATNGLAHHLLPDWPVKPARNQVLITHPIAGGVPWQGGYHYQEGYLYFRPVGDRILLGGGRHWDFAGETTADLGAHEAIRAQLARLLHEVIAPGRSLSIDRWWSGIMGVGDRKAPLIQALGQHTVAAVRLGGMGVAIGTWVGEEGARLLLGQST